MNNNLCIKELCKEKISKLDLIEERRKTNNICTPKSTHR